MEERAAIRVDLPAANPTSSYWQDPPSRLATWPHNDKKGRETHRLPTEADVAIIGSGLSGASIASNLLEAGLGENLLMLEARTACSGATGRNGGHTKPHSYREFLPNMKAMGLAEATKIVRLKYRCMKAMHAFAREHGIDCDSWEGDTVDVFMDEREFEKSTEVIHRLWEILGQEDPATQYQIWHAQQVRERFKVPGACGGISYASGSMNAYKWATGVLELAVSRGLNLWTETPVLGLEKSKLDDNDKDSGQRWIVKTARGDVKAKKVVLATNGYTAHLCPELQGTIVPLRGHMTVQRPGSKMPAGTLKTTYSFIYENGYEYMIPRPLGTKHAGDICIGGGLTKASHAGLLEYGSVDDTRLDPHILSYLADSAKLYFGENNWGEEENDPEGPEGPEGSRLRQAWTGIMGYSADGYPLEGEMPPSSTSSTGNENENENENLYICASFQGSGMVMAFLCARALTMIMVLGKDDDNNLDEWFPRAYRMDGTRLGHRFKGRLV